MESDIAPERYDRATLTLHWITALLVIEQWVGAHLINDFAKGFPRDAARSVHISFGLILGVVLIARIFWRGTQGRKLPPADRGFLQVIAKGTHYLLYALLVTIVPVGMFLVWVQGDSYFDLFKVPTFEGATQLLRHNVGQTHVWLANTILIVAGFHALAALFHHFVWRDDILRRMLPGRSSRFGA
jgi:cytochrome b561